MKLAEALVRHREELIEQASTAPFIVFLCGPNLTRSDLPSVQLRKKIKSELENEGFEVVLGEDEGIDNPTLKSIGVNAQDSEVEFIRKFCLAVVIIVDSPGSFCELGLFSWHVTHESGVFKDKTDCIGLHPV